MSNDNSEPLVNIDGTPMVSGGGIDVLGKPFGVTDTSTDDITQSCIDEPISSTPSIDDTCSFDSGLDNGFDSFSDSCCDSGFDSSCDSDFGSSFDDSF